jgi:undecaprenyl-diphosphatase
VSLPASPADPSTSIGALDLTRWPTRLGRRLARFHARTASTIGEQPAFVLSIGLGTAIAVAATYLGTRVYDGVADANGIERLDKPALRRAMRMRSPALDATAAAIARVFGPVGMPLLVVAVATALTVRRRDSSPAILIGAAGAGSLLMTEVGKDLVHRHRPPRRDAIPPFETSPSFPSGHTLNATTAAGIVAYLLMLRQRSDSVQATTGAMAALTAVGVGLSRVLLGAHWLSDVIMGWIAGAGWLALVVTSHRLHLTTRAARSRRRRFSPQGSASVE